MYVKHFIAAHKTEATSRDTAIATAETPENECYINSSD